jgi:uncharacterized protein (TIGR02646 family)
MIHIRKSATVPRTLLGKGTRAATAFRKAFAADRAGYRSGAKEFDFDRDIYAAGDVKLALRTDQSDECAFCEAKILHVTPGDVEHFRPKRGVRQARHDPLALPGYYWLAYDWSNLLLACSNCNSRHKGNLFPLVDPKKRCGSHRKRLSDEQPLFINPAETDPAPHIEFTGETAHPRAGSLHGRTTIDELSLNRTELVEHRLTLLRILQELADACEQLKAVSRPTKTQLASITGIEARLTEAKLPAAEYSAMARAALR